MKTYARDVSGFDHPIHVNRDETSQGVVTNARVAQLVEHNLAKVGVAGSNPVSRSIGDERVLNEYARSGHCQNPTTHSLVKVKERQWRIGDI